MTKVVFLSVFLLQTCIFGADWTRVSNLRAGEKVRVETTSAKQTGTLVSVDADAVRLTSGDGAQVSVPRADIQRVYARSKSNRVRNTIIGAAVGVAVGAVVYGTLGSLFRNEGREDTAFMLAVPIGVGTAVGAAMPTGSLKKVYDAAK